MSLFRVLRNIFVLLSVLTAAIQPVNAAWWEFGRNENEPVITELKFNKVDAMRVEDKMVVGRDELEGGGLVLRGRAEIGKGTIGAVEITLDGGKNWIKATLGDRGFFTYEFKPELQREYQFNVRALTTTGAATSDDEHAFKLVVSPESAIDGVKKTFAAMIDAYRMENKSAFMRHVSPDFEGILSALEDALSDDFRFLDNIRIEPNITRIMPFGADFDLYFTFNRSVTSTRSGQVVRDSAATSMSFQRTAEGFKVVRMAAPLIFGVSNQEDIATSVTEESVGKPVLVVSNRSGSATTSTQGQTTTGSVVKNASLRYNNAGPGLTWYQQNFSFETDSVSSQAVTSPSSPNDGDFGFFGDNFHIVTAGAVQMVVMGTQDIENIKEAPASGYASYPTAPGYRILVDGGGANRTFAFKLPGNAYAVVKFTVVNVAGKTATIKYKFSENGRKF